MENRTILIGDVLDKVKEIPDETVDCVITSPPYWGLRDYGAEGQWGLEPDFHDYLKKLDTLMDQLKRILKPTGSIWVNIGDTYGTISGNYEQQAKEEKKYEGMKENLGGEYPSQKQMKKGLQAKSRVGIPERFYINCIDKGWIARNHIPWIKPNAMPSSVKDRFTNKWESVFFFTKNQKYYFNLDAVREKPITELPKPKEIQKIVDLFGEQTTIAPIKEKYKDDPDANVTRLHREREGNPNHQPEGRSNFQTGKKITEHLQERLSKKQDQVIDPKTGKPKLTYAGFNERWKNGTKEYTAYMKRVQDARDTGTPHDNPLGNPLGKNPGDVFTSLDEKWQKHYDADGNCFGCGKHYTKHTVKNRAQGSENRDQRQKVDYVWCNENGKNPGDVIYDKSKPYAVQGREGTIYLRDLPPFPEVHKYLTFWREKKGVTIDWLEEQFGNNTPHHWFDKHWGSYPTREDWIKIKDLLGFDDKFDKEMTTLYPKDAEKVNDPRGKNPGDIFVINTKPFVEAHFATFPIDLPTKILRCSCPANGFVLDPFMGSGTVAVAAEQLGLNWIGIELKAEYVSDIIKKRLDKHKNERLESFVQ